MLADAAWYVRSEPHRTTQLIGDRGIAERLTSEVLVISSSSPRPPSFYGVDDTLGVISG